MSKSPRTPAALQFSGAILTILMMVGFAVTLVGAGHGIGPIGLLMVFWPMLETVLSWLGILCCILSLFGIAPRRRLILRASGLGLLSLAFGLWVRVSEAPELTLITGVLFYVTGAILLVLILFAFFVSPKQKSSGADEVCHNR